MGSGHFLVAAVDRIERRLTDYLARRPLPGVRRELAHLRAAALDALGELADQTLIEDAQLLRRLIARRCIYGVDLNELAVQLARLSIWIHTFVPGLPLSLLDHTLVRGNALVGLGPSRRSAKRSRTPGSACSRSMPSTCLAWQRRR
jgi:type II restriction/modification system DNA methylase subunit YeeA